MLLAIDTSTQYLSIALHNGEALLAESTLRAGRQHSALLAPLIKQIMAQTSVQFDDLTALAVSIGPGSYTGLRIGVALAKGLAAVRDLPLIPVTTLETVAAAHGESQPDCPLIAVVPAGRNRVIWAEYRRCGGNWRETSQPQISSWDELLASSRQPYVISGEITDAGVRAVAAAREQGARINMAPASERLRRAGYLAEVAQSRLRECTAERPFPADQVMPVYLKTPG